MSTAQANKLGPARLSNVTVEYPARGDSGKVTALREVSLDVREGELLVLVGRSGCGKTTALNVLAGLIPPSQGEVSVLGREPHAAREGLGYMFARDALLPWRTALGNVEFGLESRSEVSRDAVRSLAREYLEMVGLEAYAGHLPYQLSQGQRQRVALARTWALRPKVLLMDEPFSALDAETRESLHLEFQKQWVAHERSGVFVTHDINEAITLADRILVFAKGSIIAEFSVDFPRPRELFQVAREESAASMFREIRELLSTEGQPA